MKRVTSGGALWFVALLGSCSGGPTKVYDSWSPRHLNRVRVEQSEYGGAYGGESYDVSLIDGNDQSKLITVHASQAQFSLIWIDDYRLIVRACHGNVLFLASNRILSKALQSNDYDHLTFYTQPVTMDGVSANGRKVCP